MPATYFCQGKLDGRSIDNVFDDLEMWLAGFEISRSNLTSSHAQATWVTRDVAGQSFFRLEVVADDGAVQHKLLAKPWDRGLEFAYERFSRRMEDFNNADLVPPPEFIRRWSAPQSKLVLPRDPRQGGLIVVCDASEPDPQVANLCSQLRAFVSPMTQVASLDPPSFQAYTSEHGAALQPRPGTIAIFTAHSHSRVQSLGSVSLRDPAGAARRLLGLLLRTPDHSLPTHWRDTERQILAGAKLTDELLESLDTEIEELRKAKFQIEEFLLETAAKSEQVSELQRRVKSLERKLALGDIAAEVEDEEDEIAPPISCIDALEKGRRYLSFLDLTADPKACGALDEYPQSIVWCLEIWSGLRALNDYGRFKSTNSGISFRGFCTNPPPGYITYPPGALAMAESEQTMSNLSTRSARIFAVPEIIDPTGVRAMEPHLKISNIPPAPRIHFLDTTTVNNRVVVGYIGRHLPTA